jgi:hypothetical protein
VLASCSMVVGGRQACVRACGEWVQGCSAMRNKAAGSKTDNAPVTTALAVCIVLWGYKELLCFMCNFHALV